MAPKELAQGPYVAAKAGVEPTTLRLSHRLNQCATTPPFVGHSPQQNNNGFSIGVDFGAIFEKRHAFISFRLFATFPTKKLGFPLIFMTSLRQCLQLKSSEDLWISDLTLAASRSMGHNPMSPIAECRLLLELIYAYMPGKLEPSLASPLYPSGPPTNSH